MLALSLGPADQQQRELQGYQQLDPAALRDVAERYLRAEQLRVVLVGDPQVIAPQVAALRLGELLWLPAAATAEPPGEPPR